MALENTKLLDKAIKEGGSLYYVGPESIYPGTVALGENRGRFMEPSAELDQNFVGDRLLITGYSGDHRSMFAVADNPQAQNLELKLFYTVKGDNGEYGFQFDHDLARFNSGGVQFGTINTEPINAKNSFILVGRTDIRNQFLLLFPQKEIPVGQTRGVNYMDRNH
jgi:hypothetical protein